MTVLCIILAVFLVTSVFSMVDFEYMHMYEKLVRDHGNWHIMLHDMPMDKAKSVWNEADVVSACLYDTLNYDLDKPIFLSGQPVCVIGTEESFFSYIVTDTLTEGRFPESTAEILLNNNAKNVFGYKLGDKVTVNTPAGDRFYTVCGFFKDTSGSLAEGASLAVLNLEAFDKMAEENDQQRATAYYVQFKKSLAIKDTVARLKSSHGWTEDNVSENTAVLGILGMSTSNYIVGLYGAAAVLVLTVIAAGVLMISGSMNTSVAEMTQYFGMLRCIGAGKGQVRRIVRLEALNRLKIAIPIGAGTSILVCWGVCAVLAYGIGGEWSGMPVGRVSVVGIALGAVVGFITVLLAAAAPSRRASKVSPVAAASGSSESEYKGVALKLGLFSVPVSLGIHHTLSKKKNFILMTGSFALSIILFLSFSVMIVWIRNALTTNKPYSPDLSVYYSDYSPTLSREFADKLRDIDKVKLVYGRMHTQAEVRCRGNTGKIDLVSYDSQQFDWAKDDFLRGDISAAQTGTGNVMGVYDKGGSFETGDTMELNGKTLTVSALLSDSPFSSSDIPVVICSEKTFREYTGGDSYSVIDIQLEKGAGDETVTEIRAILSEGLILSDRRAGKIETNSTYLAFTVLVYGFLGLVALIAVFNIINSISMSTAARRRQYGMMRSVGLEKRQLVEMITAESLGYGVAGCVAGCTVGLALNAVLFKAIITNYWGIEWEMPWVQLGIIVGLVLLSSLVAARLPAKRLCESTIVDIK